MHDCLLVTSLDIVDVQSSFLSLFLSVQLILISVFVSSASYSMEAVALTATKSCIIILRISLSAALRCHNGLVFFYSFEVV